MIRLVVPGLLAIALIGNGYLALCRAALPPLPDDRRVMGYRIPIDPDDWINVLVQTETNRHQAARERRDTLRAERGMRAAKRDAALAEHSVQSRRLQALEAILSSDPVRDSPDAWTDATPIAFDDGSWRRHFAASTLDRTGVVFPSDPASVSRVLGPIAAVELKFRIGASGLISLALGSSDPGATTLPDAGLGLLLSAGRSDLAHLTPLGTRTVILEYTMWKSEGAGEPWFRVLYDRGALRVWAWRGGPSDPARLVLARNYPDPRADRIVISNAFLMGFARAAELHDLSLRTRK